jgi:hypothetical protein
MTEAIGIRSSIDVSSPVASNACDSSDAGVPYRFNH